jgi:hypothetical protein
MVLNPSIIVPESWMHAQLGTDSVSVKSGKDVITFDAIASYCKQKLGYF